jgi:uncharacterized membrane protein YraQ (UPF0718 family)
MEMTNILIFAIVGAVCLFVVAGGLASMMDADATNGLLGSAAATGAAIGGAVGYLGSVGNSSVLPSASSVLSIMSGGASSQEAPGGMKVGLPGF